jgi:hypothetical protein
MKDRSIYKNNNSADNFKQGKLTYETQKGDEMIIL